MTTRRPSIQTCPRSRKNSAPTGRSRPGASSRRRAESGRTRQIKVHDALTGAALVILAGIILWHIQGFPAMPGQKFGPAWFPGLIAIGLAICGALLVRSGLRSGEAWVAWPAW